MSHFESSFPLLKTCLLRLDAGHGTGLLVGGGSRDWLRNIVLLLLLCTVIIMVGFVGLSTYGSSLKLRRPSLNQRQFSYGVGGRSRRGRSVVATAVGVNVVKDVVVQEEDVAPSTSPRGMKRKILKDVVQREGIRLVIALFALVFATGASLFIPMMFGQVIRTVITLQPGEYSRLLKAVGIACALYIIEPLSTVVWVRTICAISDRIFKSLKIRLFQDILGHVRHHSPPPQNEARKQIVCLFNRFETV